MKNYFINKIFIYELIISNKLLLLTNMYLDTHIYHNLYLFKFIKL